MKKKAKAAKLKAIDRRVKKIDKAVSNEKARTKKATPPVQIPQKLPPKKKDAAEATGPALKRSVSAVVLELDDFDKKSLDGHRVVVQEGIASADTTVRLQCKKCGHVDEALLAKFFAVSDDKPPIAYPLEVFKEMVRKLRKKHRGCGGLTTRGIQQGLGLFDEVR